MAAAQTSASSRTERGTGLIASVAGVTVFLSLLTVAVQILVDLYQTSVVTAAGYDVTRDVAASPAQPPTPAALEAAEARLRELLGRVGDEARVEWDLGDDTVALHLVVPTRRFLVPAVAGPLGLDRVERTVVVRVEELQE